MENIHNVRSIFGVEMINKWISHAPRLVEVMLGLLLAWYLISSIMPDMDSNEQKVASIGIKTDTLPVVNVKLLSETPLFGKLQSSIKTAKPVTAKPIVKSRLDIKLLGTVVAGKSSAAIMTVGTSAESTFFLGDPLYGRVFLKSVEPDAVVLDNNGKFERVILSEGKSKPGSRENASTRIMQNMSPRPYQGSTPSVISAMPPGVGAMPPGMMGMPPGMQGVPSGIQTMPPGRPMQ